MKTSLTLIAAGAVLAAAQGLGSLPQCGQTCISNMIAIAQSQFGCASGNITCYCSNPAFGYGIRDCAKEACPNQSNAQEVISFGLQYCKSGAATTSGAASATTVLTMTGSSTTGTSVTGSSATTNGTAPASSSSTGIVTSSAVTTSALTEVIVTGGKTKTTTTGSTTLFTQATEHAVTTKALTTKITTGGKTLTTTTGMTTVLKPGKPTKKPTGQNAKTTKKATGKTGGGGKATSTGGASPLHTAAPGLIGAGLLAILAL